MDYRFQSPGRRIPHANLSYILDSTSKDFPDTGIRSTWHGAINWQLLDCEELTERSGFRWEKNETKDRNSNENMMLKSG